MGESVVFGQGGDGGSVPLIADLHTHSHLSRATSRDCTLAELHRWAQLKGIAVVGTGDCTHPGWLTELGEKLEPSAPGLYRLGREFSRAVNDAVPVSCRRAVHFMVTGEVSSIYRRDGRCRKVHSLVWLPSLAAAGRLCRALGRIGNVEADGRPILSLDPRDLVEIALEADAAACVIPAHIWTPWFSMLGSKGGFDSAAACFGDVLEHIVAVETGLSSDPPMNWRVSDLDRFTLVSNSDLHSPSRMGRNATVFRCAPDYEAMVNALRTAPCAAFGGTIDTYPEAGKYHLDGHRACGVVMEPEETRRRAGICPVCGKPLVLGVLHRVTAVADRGHGERPAHVPDHEYIVPLAELLSEVLACGVRTRSVERAFLGLLARFGPEMGILRTLPVEDMVRGGEPVVAEAIRRLRAGRVRCQPGYDGQYGTIRLFDDDERVPGDARQPRHQ